MFRLNRKRFWGGNMDNDKLSAYQTLYTCLETVAALMAPIGSVLCRQTLYRPYIRNRTCQPVGTPQRLPPAHDESVIDKALEERMKDAQRPSPLWCWLCDVK